MYEPQQLVKDNFALSTWLLIGALIQWSISLLPYRNITLITPVLLFLAYKLGRTLLMIFGLIPNTYMDGVIPGRTAIVMPGEKGTQDTEADTSVCAIVLGVRSNSPLGMFAPGYKVLGDYFKAMITQLDETATPSGYLGSSAWLSAADRGVSSELMSIVYFENEEKLHQFAHGPLHTEVMEWWHKTAKEHEHIGIMHEV